MTSPCTTGRARRLQPGRAGADRARRDPVPSVAVRCGRLIDGRHATPAEDVTILVEGDRIRQVGRGLATPAGATVIDLGRSTCLPGLIDNHTHVLLQGDITAADYDEQLLKESHPLSHYPRDGGRAHAPSMHGFTTMRDLETEGAMYADVDVQDRDQPRRHPRPADVRRHARHGRHRACTRCSGYSWELKMPEGVQIVDGADDMRQAVREQVEIRRGLDQVLLRPPLLHEGWRPALAG